MASQGPNSPGTAVDDSSVGTLAWTNPTNAEVSDGIYATATNPVSGTPAVTHYLKVTNYGFSIPTTASINGILVQVQRKAFSDFTNNVIDNSINIVKSTGAIGATNKATATHWPTTEAYADYGSSSDLWGETWTPADINNSNFGAAVSASINGFDTFDTGSVDYVSITVDYTPAATDGFNIAFV